MLQDLVSVCIKSERYSTVVLSYSEHAEPHTVSQIGYFSNYFLNNLLML